jgi:hypothetical protein
VQWDDMRERAGLKPFKLQSPCTKVMPTWLNIEILELATSVCMHVSN